MGIVQDTKNPIAKVQPGTNIPSESPSFASRVQPTMQQFDNVNIVTPIKLKEPQAVNTTKAK